MLAQRIATAAVGIPLIIVLIIIGGWPYAIVAGVALAVATAEFAHFWRPWTSPITIGAALFVLAMSLVVQDRGGVAVIALVVVGGVLVGIGAASHRSLEQSPAWAPAGILYAGVLGSTIILLRGVPDGRDWVFLAIFATFAVDTSAYVVGRALGRHKLAPRISPKKTWEGFFGGWAGGIIAVVALNAILGTGANAAEVALLAALLPILATAGDLAESAMKRAVHVKDASQLIPGHGGVLDRLDSVLFTFPLTYLIARFLVS